MHRLFHSGTTCTKRGIFHYLSCTGGACRQNGCTFPLQWGLLRKTTRTCKTLLQTKRLLLKNRRRCEDFESWLVSGQGASNTSLIPPSTGAMRRPRCTDSRQRLKCLNVEWLECTGKNGSDELRSNSARLLTSFY